MTTISFNEITNATLVDNGTGYFDKIMATLTLHIAEQWDKGKIRGPEYATTYLGAMQYALASGQQFALTKRLTEVQIDNAVKEGDLRDVEIALKMAQLDTELLNQQLLAKQIEEQQYKLDHLLIAQYNLTNAQYLEQLADTARKDRITDEQLEKIAVEIESMSEDTRLKIEQWDINKGIITNQKLMSDIDVNYKPSLSEADLRSKKAQAEQIEVESVFTQAKTETMSDTRNDNVRMQAAREYGEYLKYISAAGVVPSSLHFDNLVGLIDSIANKTDGGILTKKEVLAANGGSVSIDVKGPYLSSTPTVYPEYFYLESVGKYRVGNVVCKETESGATCAVNS